MPVVVTGGTGLIGGRAVTAFLKASPQVRAYLRSAEAAESLRAAGAKAAVGQITDVDALQVVMEGAHTVCHLVGGLESPTDSTFDSEILGSLRPVLEAARRSEVKRLLYLSYPGAS